MNRRRTVRVLAWLALVCLALLGAYLAVIALMILVAIELTLHLRRRRVS